MSYRFRMERQRRKATWFATLRRDGRLFALLALALVAIQAFQPLAAARASDSSGHLVICTAAGAEPSPNGTPVQHESCAECVVGACRLSAPGQPAMAAWTAAFELAAVQPAPRPGRSEILPAATLCVERPHGIRAPPFTV